MGKGGRGGESLGKMQFVVVVRGRLEGSSLTAAP